VSALLAERAAVVLAETGVNTSEVGDPVTRVDIDVVTIVNAVLVLVLAYLAAKLISTLLTAFADRIATARFRITLVVPVLKFAVYGVAIWVVVGILFELSTTQLVAFSGLLGAALGLGLKDLLADVVGGLVLVAEQPYRIGDKVQIGEHYGEVVNIGIRSTTLVTPNDTLIAVPNFAFFNESIANANAGNAEMLVTVDFYVDPEADVGVARDIVVDALLTSQYVYVSDAMPVTVRVEDDLYYRTVQGKAYVTDLRREMAFKTDVTERVLDAFGEADIRSPKVPAGVDSESEADR